MSVPAGRQVRWSVAVVGGLAALLAAATVFVGTLKPPNTLAAGLLQAFTLLLATWSSWEFGKSSTAAAAAEMVKPHARSAFRRLRNLYGALLRQQRAIESQCTRLESLEVNGVVDIHHVRGSLAVLEAMVTEQLNTADDALEDWRDLVPSEVTAILEEAAAESRAGDSDGDYWVVEGADPGDRSFRREWRGR